MTQTAKVAKSSGRGSKPGERRGGREKGTLNKATADIKALARTYMPEAMERLFKIATESESDAASVAAIRELFDRGFGKSKQPLVGGDDDDAPVKMALRVEFV